MALGRDVVTFIAVAAMLMSMANATSYIVGDAGSWDSGIDYAAWISGKTFKVGDELVFTYYINHDVLEVTKSNYESCIATSPISSDKSGSTTISLTAPGKRYFICGTIGHCEQGMKVEIDTVGTSSPPPVAKSPPPPAVTPPPPAANPPPSSPGTPPPSSPATPPPVATPPPSSPPTPPPVATPPPSYAPATPPPSNAPATPPHAFTPASPPTSTPVSPPMSSPSPPPKAQSPKSAPPAKSPTSSPKATSPSPSVSKMTPTPQPSSACKISYAASFAFALTMLAAI